MQKNRHFIGKQYVEFTLPNGVDGKSWLDKVSKFSNERLKPIMEKLFDRYADQDTLIQIEKLEVDIGEIHINTPDDELVNLVANRLEEQLYSVIALRNTFVKGQEVRFKSQTVGEGIFDQWLHYLEYGIMPWQAETLTESELQEKVLSSLAHQTGAGNKFRMLLVDKTRAVDRLILQHTDHFLQLIFEAFTTKKQAFLIQLLEDCVTLENRWARKVQYHIGDKKLTIPVLPLRLRFWRDIIQNYITSVVIGFNIQQLRYLIKKLFLTGEYPGMPVFIAEELKSFNSDYAVLKRLPVEILKDVSKTIQNDSGINVLLKEIIAGEKTPDDNALGDLAKSDLGEHLEKDKSSEVRRKQIEKGQNEIKSELENTNLTLNPGEIIKLKQSRNKTYRKKEHEKIAESKHEDNIVEHPAENPDKYSEQDVIDISDIDKNISIKDKNEHGKEDYLGKEVSQFNAIKTGEVIYVKYAGIVLLNPFLNNFLKKLNIVEEDIFVNDQSQQKAVHLIHFLSSGKTGLPEYEMIMAKLLCGRPFSSPIERNIELTETELNEAENLLKAAIEHWGALGNSSPAALREGFLQREGKLEKVDNGWRLVVEQKTLDILLNRLPFGWGLGTIKFPWMETPLFVEWG